MTLTATQALEILKTARLSHKGGAGLTLQAAERLAHLFSDSMFHFGGAIRVTRYLTEGNRGGDKSFTACVEFEVFKVLRQAMPQFTTYKVVDALRKDKMYIKTPGSRMKAPAGWTALGEKVKPYGFTGDHMFAKSEPHAYTHEVMNGVTSFIDERILHRSAQIIDAMGFCLLTIPENKLVSLSGCNHGVFLDDAKKIRMPFGDRVADPLARYRQSGVDSQIVAVTDVEWF